MVACIESIASIQYIIHYEIHQKKKEKEITDSCIRPKTYDLIPYRKAWSVAILCLHQKESFFFCWGWHDTLSVFTSTFTLSLFHALETIVSGVV